MYWSYVDQLRKDNDEECMSFYKNYDEVTGSAVPFNVMSIAEIEAECE
jgi:hypothetical protein